ncbi:Cadmium, cobalt and zinc/H(+)-K(+) antiporter [Salinivirga cyanobacteriivorans]|uniref:Cadmium, cobalt and zinc/H(+)-K(+) antiporter n=1 Tax=Salinivirga cyanobacteriivorans TaxID=1307839 RepID=A0A0S2HW31_9BACT|nr:cation diffusion facilitator family transporter [Salinivirga cyanobacteriivorans]ALO14248.1 Cadmium, cobalt and zinc/H(+)-K(+) antiporter [Salinivirga cyanobacteriivorans]
MHQHHNHEHTGNIRFAFVLNLLFAIAEVIGGILTNSMAIIADAVHDLGDSLSLGAAWFFEKYSRKGRTANYTYGYRRFSLLGALINSVVLIIGTVFVLTEIFERIMNPAEVKADGMFYLALAGVVINGLAALRLRRNKSLNSQMVMLHLLEDVLGWFAVLIASVVIYFTGWHNIDVWLSLVIAVWVIYNAVKGLVSVMKVVLQASPKEFDYDKTIATLAKIDGVKNVHDLHVWSLDGEYHIASLHVAVADKHPEKDIQMRQEIRKYFDQVNINHVTIETELPEEAEDCEYKDC